MNKSKIWTSDEIDKTIEKLRLGISGVNMSCFYENDIELRGYKILFKLTSEEKEEFKKCSSDIVYFVEKYCRFLTDKGRVVVPLRKYQKKILKALATEMYSSKIEDIVPVVRNLIMLQSRQSGKTTTIAAYFAWYMCFHSHRNLAILANKQATAFEIVSKVTDVFKGLPFFLKPGIENAGAGGLKLDNGCMLTSQATTKTAQIGFTIHVLYADEFAHIQNSIVRSFWRSVYPTLSSSDISQCIISSTPNGEDNLFAEIWEKSVKKQNSFYNIRVDWWEVPGHDEEWKRKTIADFGQEEFDQEFGLSFQAGKSNILFSAEKLKLFNKISVNYIHKELDNSPLDPEYYSNLLWHPNFDPNNISENRRFAISIDTGEGKDIEEIKDNDYNVANIFEILPLSMPKLKSLKNVIDINIKNMFKFVQVGIYRNNIEDEEHCANIAKTVIFDQLGASKCKIIIEMNFNGKFFLSKFSEHSDYDESVVLHTYHTKPIEGEKKPRKKPGFKMTSDKSIFCKKAKKMADKSLIIINEAETNSEFKAFGKDKNNKYRGINSHDDAAISTINLSRLYEEDEYEEFLFDFLESMEECPEKTYILSLLQKYEEKEEMSDTTFNELYGLNEMNPYNSINDFQNKYNPYNNSWTTPQQVADWYDI